MDVKLIDTLSGGEISVLGGEVKIDNGLDTAVYISLYSNNDWWAGEIGGRIYQVKKNSRENRQLLRDYIKESLQWMIDDGVAEKIDITLSTILPSAVIYDIIIKQPELSPEVIYKFSLNWENQAASVERISNYGS